MFSSGTHHTCTQNTHCINKIKNKTVKPVKNFWHFPKFKWSISGIIRISCLRTGTKINVLVFLVLVHSSYSYSLLPSLEELIQLPLTPPLPGRSVTLFWPLQALDMHKTHAHLKWSEWMDGWMNTIQKEWIGILKWTRTTELRIGFSKQERGMEGGRLRTGVYKQRYMEGRK